MEVTFDRSFSKSLDKINNKSILGKIEKIILQCEEAKSLTDIPNLKKMQGFKAFYRIKTGDYRIGIEVDNNTLNFIIIAHRKEIYRLFP